MGFRDHRSCRRTVYFRGLCTNDLSLYLVTTQLFIYLLLYKKTGTTGERFYDLFRSMVLRVRFTEIR